MVRTMLVFGLKASVAFGLEIITTRACGSLSDKSRSPAVAGDQLTTNASKTKKAAARELPGPLSVDVNCALLDTFKRE